jgi:hypothetical protein
VNNIPKLEVDQYGNKWWLLNGRLHREDGPALEFIDGDRYTYWYFDGLLHRTDGPAVERFDGYKEYWLNHVFLTQEEWFQRLTPEQQENYLWNLNE